MTWLFLNNPFLSVLERSIINALAVASYTNAALEQRQTNLFYDPQYKIFNPLYNAFNAAYDGWKSQLGSQKGSTASLDDLLDTLKTTKTIDWELDIQSKGGWKKGSSQFTACFPKGRKSLNTGEKNSRINAVNTLWLTITAQLGGALPSPEFQATRDDISDYYSTLSAARTAQQGLITVTGSGSNELMETGTAAMVGLYALLGACINQFPATPNVIEPIFDLAKIRQTEQTDWQKTIAPGAIVNVFKRTLAPTDKLKITVQTNKPITFAFVNEKNDEIGALSITVDGLEDVTVTAAELGKIPADTYFKARNTDSDVQGHFSVEIL
jgi:hypothetical protein